MKARVNTFLNIRTGTPEILPDNNPNNAFLKPGDVVEIVDTMIGEKYKGNDVWHKLDSQVLVSNFGLDIDKNLFFKENSPVSTTNDLSKKIILKNPVGSNGRGITIGILDSGIDTVHDSLNKAMLTEDSFLSAPGNLTNDHGTKVAGLIVGNDTEISGVCIDARIKSYRVIKNNQHVENQALKLALQHIIDNETDLDVINLSLDIQEDSIQLIQNLINKIVEKGIIVIVAGGSFKKANKIAGIKNIIAAGVFEESDFGEVKKNGFSQSYTISFLNKPMLSTSLTSAQSKHDIISQDSAYSSITTGIIGRFLSEKFISKPLRNELIKKYLFENSFNIKSESQPFELKLYRNETN